MLRTLANRILSFDFFKKRYQFLKISHESKKIDIDFLKEEVIDISSAYCSALLTDSRKGHLSTKYESIFWNHDLSFFDFNRGGQHC